MLASHDIFDDLSVPMQRRDDKELARHALAR